MIRTIRTVLTGALLCVLLVTGSAFAGKGSKSGGFTGSGSGGFTNKTVTVAEAKKMSDDSRVTLEGRITKQLKHEKYTFEDKTGSITIEIDDKDWNGVTVDSDDTVRIYGEIDKDHGKVEVEVERIEKIQQGKNKSSGGFSSDKKKNKI